MPRTGSASKSTRWISHGAHGAALRHREQFRFDKSSNRCVAHTAMACRLRQAQDLLSSFIVRTSACDSVFPPDIRDARLTRRQALSRAPVQFVQYSSNLTIVVTVGHLSNQF